MALHALAYCERLFFLEEVEEIRVADANVFAGRRLHDKLDKGPDNLTLELASERLGIRGKLDCVRRRDGGLIVYEHKKGRSQKDGQAWPADRIQVLAYALLLAEHTGDAVSEARVKYHASNTVVRIPLDAQEAEKEVRAAVDRARQFRQTTERPPVAASERQCRTCSLAPVCLPEEDRFARLEKPKASRLFPPDDERRVVHVVEQGAWVRKDGEQIVIRLPDKSKKALPGLMVSSLVLHGNVQVSTQALHFCAAHDIGVHWLSYGGYYVGALCAGAGGVGRKVRQHQALARPELSVSLSARVCAAKVENQVRYLLRLTRGKQRGPDIEASLAQMRQSLKNIADIAEKAACENSPFTEPEESRQAKDGLRGWEGSAGRAYFESLPKVLNVAEGGLMRFAGRNRRPPRDPFNAALSFGYALLYRDCVGSLAAVGLEPAPGFHAHAPVRGLSPGNGPDGAFPPGDVGRASGGFHQPRPVGGGRFFPGRNPGVAFSGRTPQGHWPV